MKTVEAWFAEYEESHQNTMNKIIHFICVPAIYFSIVGLVWYFNMYLALALMAFVLTYYVFLSRSLAVGMLIFNVLVIGLVFTVTYLFWTSLVIFVLAWAGQFIGHHIEGRRPSFFKDLQFLLVGPLWVIGAVYRVLKIPY